LITAVELGEVTVDQALYLGVGSALFQFIAGPWLVDLTLSFLYDSAKLESQELPEHLRQFVERVCGEHGIPFPQFRLIHDGAPQAFTYGHVPANARVVLSQGTIDLLTPEELEAVVAHEIGHVVHWDMLVMTMAQLVPLISYYVYRTIAERETRDQDNDKDGDASALIAVGAYVLYVVSEYLVLALSRAREFHADRFSGEATGQPGHLASALVKIAYGLAGQEPDREPGAEKTSRTPKLGAIGALGIFSVKSAKRFAIAGYAEAAGGADRQETIRGAMRWDLFNPWARWYELNSTHPLVAKRLRHLGNQAQVMGLEPFIEFDEVQPESYWDDFALDLFVEYLPLFILFGSALAFAGVSIAGFHPTAMGDQLLDQILGPAAIALGGAMLFRWYYRYRDGTFPDSTVAALVKQVKVSDVRPIPCTLTGTCVGRGLPGYVFSEDFVLKDATGILFLDYRQPLKILEWLFGLLRAGKYTGREVRVEGWFRRSPMPYVQIYRIESGDETARSWAPFIEKLLALAVLALGLAKVLVPGLLVLP
jgi:heat shock protein HtpX